LSTSLLLPTLTLPASIIFCGWGWKMRKVEAK
jgi:hypothetical protein